MMHVMDEAERYPSPLAYLERKLVSGGISQGLFRSCWIEMGAGLCGCIGNNALVGIDTLALSLVAMLIASEAMLLSGRSSQ